MVYLGLVDDQNDYDDAEDYADETGEFDRAPAPRVVRPQQTSTVRTVDVRERNRLESVAFDEPVAQRAPEQPRLSRITTLHPRNYNDARAIGEQFRAGVPVVMDVTEMDDADAKRLVDFAAGLTFGLRGRIEKVTRGVFLLSPEGVAVTLDNPGGAGPVEGGFYNQS